MYSIVVPIIDESMRKLCIRPYRGHKKGCPNFGKKPTCPPKALLLRDFIDLSRPVFVIWNDFNLAAHRKKMKAKHPSWSRHQLDCCLYWQRGARRDLAWQIKHTYMCYLVPKHQLFNDGRFCFTTCPEAMGVNVTKTMKMIGVELEWPPVNIARQIAIAGYEIGGQKGE